MEKISIVSIPYRVHVIGEKLQAVIHEVRYVSIPYRVHVMLATIGYFAQQAAEGFNSL